MRGVFAGSGSRRGAARSGARAGGRGRAPDLGDVVYHAPPRFSRRALVSAVRRLLSGRVEQAYLFGSYARNEAADTSDVDVIVVANTRRAWPDRGHDFGDLFAELGPTDLLVYTPAEWEALLDQPTAFIQRAQAEWIRLL